MACTLSLESNLRTNSVIVVPIVFEVVFMTLLFIYLFIYYEIRTIRYTNKNTM